MLTVLDSGTYYHHATIHGDRYRNLFDHILYLPEVVPADFADSRVILVADRQHPALLRRIAPLLLDHLARGRMLVVMGENEAQDWLPRVSWQPRPTNFWWWLEPGARPEHRLDAPDHPLFRHIGLEDTVWHYHGVMTPPPGARSLVSVPDGSLLYEDRVSTPGRLLTATLDPFYHHGSNFMPATTRFLDGFLPWLRDLAHDA